MNPLAELMKRRIAAEGPMPVSYYMMEALGHPEHGYYTTQTPFGAAGDFITAPEISQMFGELLGLWGVATWQAMGRPRRFNLVELGPGRGSLMADALRAAREQRDFLRAAKIQLVEMSPRLREQQRRALAGHRVSWHEDIGGVERGPLLLLANEFFDALPIRQFQRTERGWCERMIALDGGRLALALSPDPVSAGLLPPALTQADIGTVAEISPARDGVMTWLGERLAEQGGAAVIIDYGHGESAGGDTLQAVRRHAFADVLQDPGQADLTAHVDFAALAAAARAAGANVYGPIGQGEFLENLGISVRAQQLAAGAGEAQAANIASAHARLTEPTQMGTLFKVLAVTAATLPAPAGFEGA